MFYPWRVKQSSYEGFKLNIGTLIIQNKFGFKHIVLSNGLASCRIKKSPCEKIWKD